MVELDEELFHEGCGLWSSVPGEESVLPLKPGLLSGISAANLDPGLREIDERLLRKMVLCLGPVPAGQRVQVGAPSLGSTSGEEEGRGRRKKERKTKVRSATAKYFSYTACCFNPPYFQVRDAWRVT